MEWYQNEIELGEAINFLVRYCCCYQWVAFVSDKTPCFSYREGDSDIPEQLRQAIKDYLMKLPRESYRSLNKSIALLLGERFYVRMSAIVKILSRILRDGDPREKENKNLIIQALQIQIKHRIELLNQICVGMEVL